MADKPFIFTSGLGEPGLHRLPPADLVSPGAADADRFRRLDGDARRRLRAVRRRRRRRDRGHSVRRLDGRPARPAHAICAQEAEGLRPQRPDRGRSHRGDRVLLVEDITTDGRSKVNFCNALRQAGANVDHIFVFFFYDIYPEGLKSPDRSRRHHAHAGDLVGRAGASPRRAASSTRKLAEVEKFMHDPAGWSKAHGGTARRRLMQRTAMSSSSAPAMPPSARRWPRAERAPRS